LDLPRGYFLVSGHNGSHQNRVRTAELLIFVVQTFLSDSMRLHGNVCFSKVHKDLWKAVQRRDIDDYCAENALDIELYSLENIKIY
jgi:hypothetical protein